MCLYMLWHPHTLLGEKKEHRTSKSLSSLFFFYSIDKLLLLFVVIEEERCKLGWTSAREKKRNEKRRILTICLTSHLLLSLSPLLHYLSAARVCTSTYSSTCRQSVSFLFPSWYLFVDHQAKSK